MNDERSSNLNVPIDPPLHSLLGVRITNEIVHVTKFNSNIVLEIRTDSNRPSLVQSIGRIAT